MRDIHNSDNDENKISNTSETKDSVSGDNVILSSPPISSGPKTGSEIQKNKKKLGYILLLEQTKKKLEKIHNDITKLENKSLELEQELSYYQKKHDMRNTYRDKYLLDYEEKMSYFQQQSQFYGIEDINIITNSEIQQLFLAKTSSPDDRASYEQLLPSLYALFLEPVNKKTAIDYIESVIEDYVKNISKTSKAYNKNEKKIVELNEKYYNIQVEGTLDSHLYTGQDASLDDLIASEDVVHQIKKIITMYKNPKYFTDRGISLPKSILFSGPTDTGKTFAAKVLASEIGRKMYHIKAHDLFSEENLDPNAMLYYLFSSIIEKTQEIKEPCIIFLDEIEKIIDSMGEYASANQMVITNTIIKNIANIQKSDLDIIILAALVKKNAIDPKLLKYDLFPKQIFFSGLKEYQRKDLFALVFKDLSSDFVQFSPDINIDELVKKTDSFTAEYIKKLVAVAVEDVTYTSLSHKTKKSEPAIITQDHLLKNIDLLKEESKIKGDKKYFGGS